MSDHIKSDLPSYFNGDLPEVTRQKVESHLGECASCRHAANRARGKVSRGKRQALKAAAPDRIPNLLLTRLGRQSDFAQKPTPTPWGPIAVVGFCLIAAGWLVYRPPHVHLYFRAFSSHFKPSAAQLPTSSATATGFDVEHSSPSVVQSVPEGDRAVAGAPAVQTSSAAPVAAATPAVTPAPVSTDADVSRWVGQDSNVRDARQLVIRGRNAWRALWSEMGKTDAAPRINFNELVVVAIFAGEKPAGQYQINVDSAIDQDDAVFMPFTITGPVASATAPATPAHPYLLMTVQRSPKPIRFRPQ